MFHTPQLADISHFFSWRGIAKAGALAVLAQLIAGSIAWGQATTSIRGTVTDSSGGHVGGASVTLTNPESKIARTTTGDDGGYQFLFLPLGTYTLNVAATGFQKYEQTGLQLLVNTPVTGQLDWFIYPHAEGNAARFPPSSSLGVSAHRCQVLYRYSPKRLQAETRPRGQVALS
jgi:carboxypeptidase family protein